MEHEKEPKMMYLGTLGDFGLGNKEKGIPSTLAGASETELIEHGELLAKTIKKVTDRRHCGCIDGRTCKHNADGSAPEIRRRLVGGTSSAVETALYSQAMVLDSIEDRADVGAVVTAVNAQLENEMDMDVSAHLGGCGSANGAIEDGYAIENNESVMKATEAIVNLDGVTAHTGFTFVSALGDEVKRNAGHTAELLTSLGWDGKKYVDGAVAAEPAGVEDLAVDENDHLYHSHKEPSILLLWSESGEYSSSKEEALALGINVPFVANLDLTYDVAKVQGGPEGDDGVKRAFTAGIAKLVQTSNRLASLETPIYFAVVA